MNFYEKIDALCKAKKVSHYKLAKDLKIAYTSVNNWMHHGNIPNGETLLKLSEYFGVSVDSLLDNKKFYDAEKLEEAMHILLERRASELKPDSINCDSEDEEAYKKGYAAGYMDLLEDLDNLIYGCHYFQEYLQEE